MPFKFLGGKITSSKKTEEKISSYYDFRGMMKSYPDATYYMCYSGRSDGKTFSGIDIIIEDYCKHGRPGVYIRRMDTDIKGSRGDRLCMGPVSQGRVSLWSGGQWEGVYHQGQKYFLCRWEEKTKRDGSTELKRVCDTEPFMWSFSLNTQEHDKSGEINNPRYIFFDEFLTRSFYLQDEFVEFQNLLSTIIRDREDCKILMAGNTISKIACPYFAEMGLGHVKEQEQGTIDLYEYGDSGLQVACEYGAERKRKKTQNKYFAFGNPRLQMITSGKWEIRVHPHLPCKYRPKDVRMTFYIDYDDYLLTGEVIQREQTYFLFIHPKTTELRKPRNDLIYSDKYDPRQNWRRSIMFDTLPVSGKIRQLIQCGKVYFSDNETGEIFASYVDWSSKNR